MGYLGLFSKCRGFNDFSDNRVVLTLIAACYTDQFTVMVFISLVYITSDICVYTTSILIVRIADTSSTYTANTYFHC